MADHQKSTTTPQFSSIVSKAVEQAAITDAHEMLPRGVNTAAGAPPSAGQQHRPADRGAASSSAPAALQAGLGPEAVSLISSANTTPTTNTVARSRFQAAYRAIGTNTLEFLGLTDDWASKQNEQWTNQRLRLADRQGTDTTAHNKLQLQKEQQKNRRRELKRRSRGDLLFRAESGLDPTIFRRSVSVPEPPAAARGDDVDGDRSSDSDEEPHKVSVAVITALAVTKAVNKWKTKTAKSAPALSPDTEEDVSVKFSVDATDSYAADVYSLPDMQTDQKSPGPSKDKQKTHIHAWFAGFGRQVKESYNESRPYFTWWVTSVQFSVLLLSLLLYPMAPFGIALKNITGQILTTSLSMEAIEYEEPASMWLGPQQHALVALGAKFTPCMRWDATVQEGILRQQELEELTGCCVRYDQSGCVQTTDGHCSDILSHWDKWMTDEPGPEGRLSGPVCGQDPRTCVAPASVSPNVWPDDITEWPICQSSNTSSVMSHSYAISRDSSANCEVIGRPCCIGIHGECHIITREHCDFLHGTFHGEAALCSQVFCLNDVCRMLDFLNPEVPDQFYRLWVSLFIHPGIIPFGLTLMLHIILLRKLEKFAGTVRVTIIYILSGITGNLASAIFVPYRPEAGPSGSLAGTIGCFFVIFLVDVKDELRSSWVVVLKWAGFLWCCFVVGLFPGIDNYANIFGFLMGSLLALALLPHIGHDKIMGLNAAETLPLHSERVSYEKTNTSQQQCKYSEYSQYSTNELSTFNIDAQSSKKCRLIVVLVSLVSSLTLLVTLFIVFYLVPFRCDWCAYLDCIPITTDFCAEQQTSFERHRIIT
uniref:Inactive rhomboid protein 1-like n=1 Tax=Hirondellea gigas TaxID=1518452 RepID=A0A6A7FXB2_9CRUS